MEQITLIKRDGTNVKLFCKESFCTVSNAVQNVTLMGDDSVQLTIKSTKLIDFAKGDKIMVGGEEYSIRTKVTRELLSEEIYSYEAVFYGVMYELMKSQYRNCDADGKSTKSTFDLTYSLTDYIKVVIYNVSRDYPGIWKFDYENCPDTDPITLQFSKQNCLQVVQTVCKEFEYEFRIDQEDGIRIMRIGKFGAKINPPAGNVFFEWGKGNGLYKLKEQKVDDKSIITRLWVEGGTQNIRSDYRDYSDRLQLPCPARLNQREHTLSDGTVIPAKSEYIGIDNDAKRYIEDTKLRDEIGSDEDTEYYEDIYPKRTGTVTALGSDIYSFVDNTMDFDLCEKDANGTKYLIDGVTAKITFISGKLAGQQFELKDKGEYMHESKTFSIIKYTDERGLELPTADTDAFRIQIGDKYKLTEINLPKSYEDYAEEDLWYAGYDDFKDRKQARAQYVLTFDRSYFINSMPLDSDTCVFHCGDYIPVKDSRFSIEKNIRIQQVSRNILLDHDYTLTLSDTTAVSVQTQTVLDVKEHNIIIDNNRLRDLNKARRGWRTTEELRNMVYDTDGFFDSENIRPNSIDTNMLTVGSKSQQFILIGSILQANAKGQPNRFDVTAGILAHFSIDETIKQWNMSAISVILTEAGGYYVFAKCSKDSNSGVYFVTQEQLKVEPVNDQNNYYFQVGIIGALHIDDNFRDFVTTYGFTRINGNTITTGKIVSSDKSTYFDLDAGEIGGKIKFVSASGSYQYVNDAIGSKNCTYVTTPMPPYNIGDTWLKSDGDIMVCKVSRASGSFSVADWEKMGNYATPSDLNNYVQNAVYNDDIAGLQAQIDGQIESYFCEYDPTNSNYPANEWITAEAKERHLNDTFTNNLTGASWRYSKAGNVYSWVVITDTATQEALRVAGLAKDTADGKRRVFVTTPTTPYDAGDLWTQGVAGDIMVCKVSRVSGSFSVADWEKAAKYTDDSATDYLRDAVQGSTEINGGLVLSNVILARDSAENVRAGISGLANDGVSFFADTNDAYNKSTEFVKGAWSKRPNFLLDDTGKLWCQELDISSKIRATKENLVIEASTSNPFVQYNGNVNYFKGSDTVQKRDNIFFNIGGGTEGVVLGSDKFSWDVSDSGRVIRIVNTLGTTSKPNKIVAPLGMKFYENGELLDHIVFGRETLELLGYGEPNSYGGTIFRGWIVLNRIPIDAAVKNAGAEKRILFQGFVGFDGTTITKKIWSSYLNVRGGIESFDIVVGAGYISVGLPINLGNKNFHVSLSAGVAGYYGDLYDRNDGTRSISLNHKDNNKFVVTMRNGYNEDTVIGSFYFEVISTYGWEGLTQI